MTLSRTFGVNTLAHFWTLKAFLPAMIEQKEGHIVTMSSVMGITGTAQMSTWRRPSNVDCPDLYLADYCASKASLISLDQALRYELDNR